jgi:uncharacterized membrane protein
MNLNTEQWYVRWFFWSLGIWEEFNETYQAHSVEINGTNLCFFVRTIVLYVPVVLLSHAIAFGLCLLAFVVAPIMMFGGRYYAYGVGAIVAIVAVLFGAVFFYEYVQNKKDAKREWNGQRVRRTPSAREPSFGKLLWDWAVAQKQKVCPMITFSNRQPETE